KDRVYFWGDEMVVDGPTSIHSPDMHFDAWAPTLHERFEGEDSLDRFVQIPANVTFEDGALHVTSASDVTDMLLKDVRLENFFLEVNIRFDNANAGPEGQAGVTVWHQDEQNYVRLFIDRDELTYVTEVTLDG